MNDLMKMCIPDRCFLTFDKLTPEFLKRRGIKGLILDIDNTIAPYEEATPGVIALDWFKRLDEAGIAVAFVSNNDRARVTAFNDALGYPRYYKSGKPSGKYIRMAMAAMGTDRTNTALMGDQVFTDVLAARLAGLRYTFLVPPIKDKTDWFTRLKRQLERPIIQAYLERRRQKKLLRQKRRAEKRRLGKKKRFVMQIRRKKKSVNPVGKGAAQHA